MLIKSKGVCFAENKNSPCGMSLDHGVVGVWVGWQDQYSHILFIYIYIYMYISAGPL